RMTTLGWPSTEPDTSSKSRACPLTPFRRAAFSGEVLNPVPSWLARGRQASSATTSATIRVTGCVVPARITPVVSMIAVMALPTTSGGIAGKALAAAQAARSRVAPTEMSIEQHAELCQVGRRRLLDDAEAGFLTVPSFVLLAKVEAGSLGDHTKPPLWPAGTVSGDGGSAARAAGPGAGGEAIVEEL